MNVLITGASGTIGGAILAYCLQHSAITSITTLTRKPLPPTNPKCQNLVLENWKSWDGAVLAEIAHADAMIWAMGTFDGNEDVNVVYPLAFQEAFLGTLQNMEREKRFRYIHLSGALTEQDQNRSLYFLSAARKIKGVAEKRCLEFAEAHSGTWQTFIIRPGGILSRASYLNSLREVLMGTNWLIREDELGAFVAGLVVCGREDEGIILNAEMVAKGRELLQKK